MEMSIFISVRKERLPKMWGKTTIKDVASKCGVSTATVSRAINNNGYVSKELKDMILSACSELGYIPNSTARSLKINSTGIIGYITSDISNQYHITVAKAIEDCINEYYPDVEVKIEHVDGLAECKKVLLMAKAGKKNGYLIEGMACPGGCVAGAGTIIPIQKAKMEVDKIVKSSTNHMPQKELRKIQLD